MVPTRKPVFCPGRRQDSRQNWQENANDRLNNEAFLSRKISWRGGTVRPTMETAPGTLPGTGPRCQLLPCHLLTEADSFPGLIVDVTRMCLLLVGTVGMEHLCATLSILCCPRFICRRPGNRRHFTTKEVNPPLALKRDFRNIKAGGQEALHTGEEISLIAESLPFPAFNSRSYSRKRTQFQS